MDRDQGTSPPELAGLDDLFAAARRGSPADELRELRTVLRRLPSIGPYNALLVHAQRPGARFVATRWTWEERFARRLRPGARPLVILRPFGPVDLVFDVADTEGPPLPRAIRDPFRVRGGVSADGVRTLMHRVEREGIRARLAPLGPTRTGSAEVADLPHDAPGGTPTHTVVVNAELDPAAQLVALAHELGHVLCHHLPMPRRPVRRDVSGLSRESREVEAETVAWLLAARLGLDAPTGEHLDGHLGSDGELPPLSIETVVSAVGRIEALAGGLEPLARLLSAPHAQGAPSSPDAAPDAARRDPRQGVLDLPGVTDPLGSPDIDPPSIPEHEETP